MYLELDLPPTGIIELEEQISLPHFNGPYCEADHRGNQSSHFEAHFASQVALRRLCGLIHQNLTECKSNNSCSEGRLMLTTGKQHPQQPQVRARVVQEHQVRMEDQLQSRSSN